MSDRHERATDPHVTIVPAEPADVPVILGFIRELAAYERLAHMVVTDEADLHRWLFGPERVAEALVAREDEQPVGFALFFPNFSTFLGRPGIYLEDLYVREARRGRGIGRALLTRLAQIAVARGWGRVEWSVLDWNEPAIRFYRGLGTELLQDWRTCRLTGEALRRLAHASEGQASAGDRQA